MYLVFFFVFICQSPTELYTLSLHDALPISAGRPWGFDPHGLAGARSHRDRPRSPTVELLVPEPLDDLPADDVLTVEDRKSTRLNSSHVKISYAVFCLKKKKKKKSS